MDLDDIATRLGVPVEEVDRVHRLAGDRPSAPLPAKADAPAILDRLAVLPDDANEIMAGRPDADSPLWTPELRWLLDRAGPRRSRRPRLAVARSCATARTWPRLAASQGRPPLALATRPLPHLAARRGTPDGVDAYRP
ncbi:hypothetical protein [Micromonospora nigra]|uniref:hypothetical protein n=1 Tax=Micromonospora nigra TaxID=145857 RepID=UPI000AFBD4AD|nr:hypothetical protein [Micromonospora nigra]